MSRKTIVIIIRDNKSDFEEGQSLSSALAAYTDTDAVILMDRYAGEGKFLAFIHKTFYGIWDKIDRKQKEKSRFGKKILRYYRNIYRRFMPDIVLCLSPLATKAMLRACKAYKFSIELYAAVRKTGENTLPEFTLPEERIFAIGEFVPQLSAIAAEKKKKFILGFGKAKEPPPAARTEYDLIAEKLYGIINKDGNKHDKSKN